MEQAAQSWTPQKPGLASESQALMITNKDQSRELARALERSTRLGEDLQVSSRAHRDAQRLAEKDRAELEHAHLRTVDRDVSTVNEILARSLSTRLTRRRRTLKRGLHRLLHRLLKP